MSEPINAEPATTHKIRHPRRGLLTPMLMAAAIGVGFGCFGRPRRSGQAVRNDPARLKTPADIEALTAAASRRERRAIVKKINNFGTSTKL